jgi:DNA-directed RNA polymerase subunit M/transcription elongation factor TFIIS
VGLKFPPSTSKTLSIKDQLQRLTFQDPDVKYLAQQALVSHVRSVHPHHDKAVFKVEALPVEAFAASLGLAGAPKIRLLSRTQAICTTCPAVQSENEEDLPSSGSANDNDERGSDVEDMGTSQEETEQGKVTKVCPSIFRTPRLIYTIQTRPASEPNTTACSSERTEGCSQSTTTSLSITPRKPLARMKTVSH